jgi:hypothetical protein
MSHCKSWGPHQRCLMTFNTTSFLAGLYHSALLHDKAVIRTSPQITSPKVKAPHVRQWLWDSHHCKYPLTGSLGHRPGSLYSRLKSWDVRRRPVNHYLQWTTILWNTIFSQMTPVNYDFESGDTPSTMTFSQTIVHRTIICEPNLSLSFLFPAKEI